MSSIIGMRGNAGQSSYAASKAGIIGFTKSIAAELGSRNIRCNAIAPGFVKTDMTNYLKEGDSAKTFLEKILESTTKFVVKYSLAIIIIAIVIASMGVFVDGKVGVETDIETFMPQDMEALSDIHEIRDVLGSTNQMAIYMEGENILAEENLIWMNETTESIEDKYSEIIVDVKSIDNIVNNVSTDTNLSYTEYIETVNDLYSGEIADEAKMRGQKMAEMFHFFLQAT